MPVYEHHRLGLLPRWQSEAGLHRVAVSIEHRRPLSEELGNLVARFAEKQVTLREVVAVLQGRAYTLLIVLLALPFCTPIPLPGLSTPFGLVIALVGFRLALRQEPWLPRKLLDTPLPPRFFGKVLAAGRKIIHFLERFLRPRMSWLVDEGVLHHGYGVLILICGLLLLLPLPIPFSNFFPALAAVLTAAALMERDGLCAILGGVVFLVTLAFFAAIAWGGVEGASWMHHWLGFGAGK